MKVEAVLLTGGASRRMGIDKSSLVIEGKTLGERIAGELLAATELVTVLGRLPLLDCTFLADEEVYAGPRSALSRFTAIAEHVFVASCDLPLFRREIVPAFLANIGEAEALMPIVGDRPQPTCALYRASSFESLRANANEPRLMAWVDELNWKAASDDDLRRWGLDPRWILGFNTMADLAALLDNASDLA